jgi:hypothetical protein
MLPKKPLAVAQSDGKNLWEYEYTPIEHLNRLASEETMDI